MNTQDFETGQDIIRALQSANAQIGQVLNNLAQHPERLRGVGVDSGTDPTGPCRQTLDQTIAIGQANAIQKLADKLAASQQHERDLLEALFRAVDLLNTPLRAQNLDWCLRRDLFVLTVHTCVGSAHISNTPSATRAATGKEGKLPHLNLSGEGRK